MLINNNQVFNLDSKTTPAILWGSLVPSEDFNSADLIGAAVGTLYVSVATVETEDCTITPLDATLWQKVADSRDACGGLSQASDWKSFSFQFSTGAQPPNGATNDWCHMSTGSFYLQTSATCSTLWLKAYGNCDDGDWIDISSPGQCAVVGYGCPDEAALADQAIGTYYVDERSDGYIIYVKLNDDLQGKDWWATNGLAFINYAGTPTGVTGDEDLDCMPVGSVLRDTTITIWTSLWLKVENEQDGYDWKPLTHRTNLQYASQAATATGYTIQYETWTRVPNNAALLTVGVPDASTWIDYTAVVTFKNTTMTAEDFGTYCTIEVKPTVSIETGAYGDIVPAYSPNHYYTMLSGQQYVTATFAGKLLSTGGTTRFNLEVFFTAQNSATGTSDVEVDGCTVHLYWDEELS